MRNLTDADEKYDCRGEGGGETKERRNLRTRRGGRRETGREGRKEERWAMELDSHTTGFLAWGPATRTAVFCSRNAARDIKTLPSHILWHMQVHSLVRQEGAPKLIDGGAHR
jgi:hypothetical protein